MPAKGQKVTSEDRAKKSAAIKRRYAEDPTYRKRVGVGISKALAGRTLSEAHRKAIGDGHRGRTHTDEHNAAVSAALMGRSDIGMAGKHHSEQSKRQSSKAQPRKLHRENSKARYEDADPEQKRRMVAAMQAQGKRP